MTIIILSKIQVLKSIFLYQKVINFLIKSIINNQYFYENVFYKRILD